MGELAEQLRGVSALFDIPDDDLVGNVLVPAMRVTADAWIAAGFFSSHCLAQIAPGLADFISAGDQPLRLLMSPMVSSEDREAIARAVRTPEEVIETTTTMLFEKAALAPSKVARHTVECLAYLVAANRLELRVVLMPAGQYHKKIWLFIEADDVLAVHGSGNATERGLLVNGEQMSVDCSWWNERAAIERINKLLAGYQDQWENKKPPSLTLTAPHSLDVLADMGSDRVPTAEDFWEAWRADHAAGLEPPLPLGMEPQQQPQRLRIPSGLEWQTGRFAHQGRAVVAFEENGRRGILAIATGGGKTKTSLVCAVRYQEDEGRPMLLVVLVPSRPLADQWQGEVRAFGVEPLYPSGLPAAKRRLALEEVRTALTVGELATEVLVITNQLFLQDEIRDFVASMPDQVATMVIADEVHNLGVPSFTNDPPERFDARLGLSATPVRQYDAVGTAQIMSYFGESDPDRGATFEFDLGEAIAAGCLVPYEYHLHEVTLTEEEMERWSDLTEQLRRYGYLANDDGQSGPTDDRVSRLLRDRRSVLEHASGKLAVLRDLLLETGPRNVRRTLIYASAKTPPPGVGRQLDAVNGLLSELGVSFHQYTYEETQRVQHFLSDFAAGEYQVLTAMKVLDEGVDLPQTDTAYFMASSSVRREWVQRRGRILRTAPGKTTGVLHDFFVVPPDPTSRDGRLVLRGELARANEFADEASNEYSPSGPRQLTRKYDDIVWAGDQHAGT